MLAGKLVSRPAFCPCLCRHCQLARHPSVTSKRLLAVSCDGLEENRCCCIAREVVQTRLCERRLHWKSRPSTFLRDFSFELSSGTAGGGSDVDRGVIIVSLERDHANVIAGIRRQSVCLEARMRGS